jgi:DNA-binding HxlR family transcriptional regulator
VSVNQFSTTLAVTEASIRLCDSDYALLQAVSQGQLRNSDLRAELYKPAKDRLQRRRQAAVVTRKLAMLRAHGLLRKTPHSQRYQLTPKGRRIITALLALATLTLNNLQNWPHKNQRKETIF